jgi:hypothetical protein
VGKILWTVTVKPDLGTVTVELGDELDYCVEVEIRNNLSDSGELEPVAAGINVHRWPDEGGRYRAVAPREIQRLPLTRIRDAALIAWRGGGDWPALDDKLRVPQGRPEKGRSTPFYKEIADSYRQCKAQGVSPAKTIAKRKRVDENTVYTWIHRARELGLLEPPERSRKGK